MENTDSLYAVIGNPIAHSRSPFIHAEFAQQTGKMISYTSILAPLDGFVGAVKKFQSEGGKGLNVTVPFKKEAWRLATNLADRAREVEAVNTLKFETDGTIFGDNTDGIGLVRDLQQNLGFRIRGKRILIAGAGGAAWGVVGPLLREAPETLLIANRTSDKAKLLEEHFRRFGTVAMRTFSSISYSGLASRQFDLVVNATSSGLVGELPPIPPGVFAPDSLAYDMMYGKETPFMKFAREQGAGKVTDGLGMLVEQAAESFYIWHKVHPATQPVIALLRTSP